MEPSSSPLRAGGDLIDSSTAYMDRIVLPLYVPDFTRGGDSDDTVLTDGRLFRLRMHAKQSGILTLSAEERAILYLAGFRQAAVEYFAAPAIPKCEMLLDLALRCATAITTHGSGEGSFPRVNWMAAVGTQRIEYAQDVVSGAVMYYNAASIAMTLGYMTARTTLKINPRTPSHCWFSTAMNIIHYVFLEGIGADEEEAAEYATMQSALRRVVGELQRARLIPDSFVWRALYDAAYIAHVFEKLCIREYRMIEEGGENPLVAIKTWLAARAEGHREAGASFDPDITSRILQLMPLLHNLQRAASRWISHVIQRMPGSSGQSTLTSSSSSPPPPPATAAAVETKETTTAHSDTDEYSIMGMSAPPDKDVVTAAAAIPATPTSHTPGEVFGYLSHAFNWLVRLVFCLELNLGELGVFVHLLDIAGARLNTDVTDISSKTYYTAYVQAATNNILYPYFSGDTTVPGELMWSTDDVIYDGPYVIPPIFAATTPRFFIWGARFSYTTLHERLIRLSIETAPLCTRLVDSLIDTYSSLGELKKRDDDIDQYIRGVLLLDGNRVNPQKGGIGDRLVRLPTANASSSSSSSSVS